MKHLLFFLFTFSSFVAIGQTKFYAQVDTKEVAEDSYITYTVVFQNARASNYKPPPFENFIVLSGPNKSSRQSNNNGVRSSLQSYSYKLQPKKVGNLRIASAQASIGGKPLQTKPITVRSVKEKNKKFFIESVIPDSGVYLGQQILVDYVFYYQTDQDINSINIQSEDEFDGFYSLSIKEFEQNVQKKKINGIEYVYQTVRKLALFPQKIGDFEVDPTTFVVYIATPNSNSRGFGSMFGSFREEFTKTKSKKLRVNPLPKAEPDFIGAVGNYQISTTSNKQRITTDQSISLILTVYGDGDPELMSPPVLELDPSLEVYDPNFIKENKYVDQGRQKHKTVYEYLIVPKKTGQYKIDPSITYFNPDSNAFLSARTTPINLEVIKGSGNSVNPVDATLSERADKMYPFLNEVSLSKTKTSFFNSIPFWLCLGLLFSAYPVLGFMKYRQMEIDAIDPELLKSQNARKVAVSKLASAKSFMEQNDQRSFYNEVSKSILGYASDKIKIPASELSKQNIAQKLEALNIQTHKIEAITSILQSCEMSLFAGANESAKMQETYNSTIETITEIENELS